MTKLGTALTLNATKIMMCGCGELGKDIQDKAPPLAVIFSTIQDFAKIWFVWPQ